MITSKDRAKLRSIISTENSVCQIGKEGLSKNCLESINLSLNAREIIKISVLQNCDDDVKSLADKISNLLKCEVVGITGRKILIYRFNKDKKNHIL